MGDEHPFFMFRKYAIEAIVNGLGIGILIIILRLIKFQPLHVE